VQLAFSRNLARSQGLSFFGALLPDTKQGSGVGDCDARLCGGSRAKTSAWKWPIPKLQAFVNVRETKNLPVRKSDV
jgi:hypothetical protein